MEASIKALSHLRVIVNPFLLELALGDVDDLKDILLGDNVEYEHNILRMEALLDRLTVNIGRLRAETPVPS